MFILNLSNTFVKKSKFRQTLQLMNTYVHVGLGFRVRVIRTIYMLRLMCNVEVNLLKTQLPYPLQHLNNILRFFKYISYSYKYIYIHTYIVATRYTIVFYLTASTTPQSQGKLQAAFIQ